MSDARPRIGLALGAGGARGAAHIGVLRRLCELGVPIDYIAGTSAGALVGGSYLAGTLDLLTDLVTHLDWMQAVRLFWENRFGRSRKITTYGVERFLMNLLQAKTFAELPQPLAVVATDLENGTEVVFSEGELALAIRASIAIPGIFAPVRLAGRDLVDGALLNPLPVSQLRRMGATRIIAVDVNLGRGLGVAAEEPPQETDAKQEESQPLARLLEQLYQHWPALARTLPDAKDGNSATRPRRKRSRTPLEAWTLATRIAENEITRNCLLLDPPDLLLQPAVGDIATLDPSHSRAAIRAGEAAVDARASEIEALKTSTRDFGLDLMATDYKL